MILKTRSLLSDAQGTTCFAGRETSLNVSNRGKPELFHVFFSQLHNISCIFNCDGLNSLHLFLHSEVLIKWNSLYIITSSSFSDIVRTNSLNWWPAAAPSWLACSAGYWALHRCILAEVRVRVWARLNFFGSYISCVFNCYCLPCELHLFISIIWHYPRYPYKNWNPRNN